MTSVEIGKIIKDKRKQMRLTQSQVVEGEITRNMLSQIESGAALPSFKTLQFLAGRLGLTVAVLEEGDLRLTNNSSHDYIAAKNAFNDGSFTAVLGINADIPENDPLYDEFMILKTRAAIEIAEAAYIRRDLNLCIEYAGKAISFAAVGMFSSKDYAAQAENLISLAEKAQGKTTAKKA
jgi:transcriptional regulator with XRE-family HTH domain